MRRQLQVWIWGAVLIAARLEDRIQDFIQHEFNKVVTGEVPHLSSGNEDGPIHIASASWDVDAKEIGVDSSGSKSDLNSQPAPVSTDTTAVRAAIARRRRLRDQQREGIVTPQDDDISSMRPPRRRRRRTRDKRRRNGTYKRSRTFGRSTSDRSEDEDDADGLDAIYDLLEENLAPNVPPMMQNVSAVCSNSFSLNAVKAGRRPTVPAILGATRVQTELARCNANLSPTLRIGVSLRFFKIVQVEFARGEFAVSLWVRMFWADLRLLYKGEDFIDNWSSGTDYVPIAVNQPGDNEIWVPYLALVNNMQPDLQETLNYFFPAKVFDTHFLRAKGYNVYWARQMVLRAVCPPHVLMFPFDIQYCPFDFQLWGLNPIRFTYSFVAGGFPPVVDSSFPSEAEVWDVKHAVVHPMSENIDGDITDLRYMMAMARDPDYYVSNFVWPLALVTLFAYLSFWLPFQLYDRVTLSVTILLAVFAIMYITAASRPPLGQDTWIDVYQAGCIALSLVPAVETIIIARLREQLHRRNQQREAEWKQLRHSASEPNPSASIIDPRLLIPSSAAEKLSEPRRGTTASGPIYHGLPSTSPEPARLESIKSADNDVTDNAIFWQLPVVTPILTVVPSATPIHYARLEETDRSTVDLVAPLGPRGLWPQVLPAYEYGRRTPSLVESHSGEYSVDDSSLLSDSEDLLPLSKYHLKPRCMTDGLHGSSPPSESDAQSRRVHFGERSEEPSYESCSVTGRTDDGQESQKRRSHYFKRLRTIKDCKRLKRAHQAGTQHLTRSLGLMINPEGPLPTTSDQCENNFVCARRGPRGPSTSRTPQDRILSSRSKFQSEQDTPSIAHSNAGALTPPFTPKASPSLRSLERGRHPSHSLHRRREIENASEGLLCGTGVIASSRPQPADPTALPNFIDRMFQILYPGVMLTFFIERFFFTEINNPLRLFGVDRFSVTILAVAVVSCLYLLWIFAMTSHIAVAFPFSESHLGYKLADALNMRIDRAFQQQHRKTSTPTDGRSETPPPPPRNDFKLLPGGDYTGGGEMESVYSASTPNRAIRGRLSTIRSSDGEAAQEQILFWGDMTESNVQGLKERF